MVGALGSKGPGAPTAQVLSPSPGAPYGTRRYEAAMRDIGQL
jgi:hypothetical protein